MFLGTEFSAAASSQKFHQILNLVTCSSGLVKGTKFTTVPLEWETKRKLQIFMFSKENQRVFHRRTFNTSCDLYILST
jgi:hypothetical protein